MSTTTTRIPIPGTEMLYGFNDPDKYIYHYTKSTTFLNHILPTNTLRLSRYTKTNDPKESKSWKFDSTIQDPSKHNFEDWPSDNLSREMNNGLKDKTNITCFSCDHELTGDHTKDICNRGWCKPRMWAQYGDEHKGVCLVFDRKKMEDAIASKFGKTRPHAFGRVRYLDRPIVENLKDPTYFVIIDHLAKLGWKRYIRFHLQHAHQRLFFEKNADWASENEYRCIVWDGNGANEYVDYGTALCGIMFGASMPEETIRIIFNAVHKQNLFTQQLVWNRCTPWYNLQNSFGWEIRYREEMRGSSSNSNASPPTTKSSRVPSLFRSLFRRGTNDHA